MKFGLSNYILAANQWQQIVYDKNIELKLAGYCYYYSSDADDVLTITLHLVMNNLIELITL